MAGEGISVLTREGALRARVLFPKLQLLLLLLGPEQVPLMGSEMSLQMQLLSSGVGAMGTGVPDYYFLHCDWQDFWVLLRYIDGAFLLDACFRNL